MRVRALLPPSGAARRLLEAHVRAMRPALGRGGGVESLGVAEWAGGRGTGNPGEDILLTSADVLRFIPAEYAAIVVIADAQAEHKFAKARPRTRWIAPNDWAAYCWAKLTREHPYRIIFPPVEQDRFFPAERQRLRNVDRPVVLHNGQIEAVADALGADFDVRQIKCSDSDMPNALRQGDIWLSLGGGGADVAMATMRALTTDLLVVGPNDGVLWPHHKDSGGAVAVPEIGAVVFDGRQREQPNLLAAHVHLAWAQADRLRGRKYARRWWSGARCANRWGAALADVAKQLSLVGGFASVARTDPVVPDSVTWAPPPVPRTDRHRPPAAGARDSRQELFLRYGRDSSVRV